MAEIKYELKGLPHHDEAERVLLGSMLLDSGNIGQVLLHLRQDDFYHRHHQLIFRAILERFERDEEVDSVLISEELIKLGELQNAGGYEYLDDLTRGIPRTTNVGYYAGIVREKAMLRRIARFGQELTEEALTAETSPLDAISKAESTLFELREGDTAHGFRKLDELVKESYQIIQERAALKGGLIGLSTGFLDFDRYTCGLQKGDLVIIAARPAMGKTSFCLNIAVNAALHANARVAIYSLEMPSTQLTMRLLGSEARVGISALRAGKLSNEEWSRVGMAAAAMGETNIYIDDSGESTVSKMRAELKRLNMDAGVDLVIIDYLQLMTSSNLYSQQNRVQEVSAISRGLKIMAKEIDCPVLALSQLSRAAEQRSNHRPQLSDLRESGSIEQDADMVCFLYREDYYNEKNKDSSLPPDSDEGEFGLAELKIAKHRNGPTGTINLAFFKKFTRFENYSDDLGYA